MGYLTNGKRTFGIVLGIVLAAMVATTGGSWLTKLAHPKPVQAALDVRDFWFLNGTGGQINQIFVALHEQTTWGSSILPAGVGLGPRIGFLVTFDSGVASSCAMDFKLVFSTGAVEKYTSGFNTCNLHAVIFTPKHAIGY
ncbi:MAG TPA: hypothetical protein VHX37_02130 [Acidobacteriaceae bacterium]|jgi:hypothetical protein|nr:hypothetical protein [Acidobacteriaceae bacterium]